MRIVNIVTTQTGPLKQLFESLKEILTDVNIDIIRPDDADKKKKNIIKKKQKKDEDDNIENEDKPKNKNKSKQNLTKNKEIGRMSNMRKLKIGFTMKVLLIKDKNYLT